MKKTLIALTSAASVLVGTAASAAPLSVGMAIVPDNGIEKVRMICDGWGRCWHTPHRRVILRESYGYLPQERYVPAPGYYDHGYVRGYDHGYYNPGPSIGFGVGAGGFGVGVGVGPSW